MINFLIMYEIKQREIESIILIGNELKSRGYTVAYLSFYELFDKKKYKKYYNNVDVVIMPSLYHNDEVMKIVYEVAGKVKKIVNLQWEQVGTIDTETDYDSYMYPHDLAKKAVHFCWGNKPANNLKSAGVFDKNIVIAGPIHMDFLRNEFRSYYLSKIDLFKKYNIDSNNKTILFISSFTYANMNERQIIEMQKAWGNEWVNTQKNLSTESFDELVHWIEKILKENDTLNFIYRPHPEENGNKKLIELEEKYKNFRVISEYSVKQWILICDKVITWISTSIAEAYYAKKYCLIVRPVPIPIDQEITIYLKAKFINNQNEFIDKLYESNVHNVNEEVLKSYYDFDENVPSYIRICDELENIINNESYNFEWNYDLIQKYNFRKLGNAIITSSIKTLYLKVLELGYKMRNKYKLSLGRNMNSRIDNYYRHNKKIENNVATEEDIISISNRLNKIVNWY